MSLSFFTYSKPKEKTNEIPNLRFGDTCSFQIVRCGRIRIIISTKRLNMAEGESTLRRSAHVPGIHLIQILLWGVQ
jgi:hypothetical protein